MTSKNNLIAVAINFTQVQQNVYKFLSTFMDWDHSPMYNKDALIELDKRMEETSTLKETDPLFHDKFNTFWDDIEEEYSDIPIDVGKGINWDDIDHDLSFSVDTYSRELDIKVYSELVKDSFSSLLLQTYKELFKKYGISIDAFTWDSPTSYNYSTDSIGIDFNVDTDKILTKYSELRPYVMMYTDIILKRSNGWNYMSHEEYDYTKISVYDEIDYYNILTSIIIKGMDDDIISMYDFCEFGSHNVENMIPESRPKDCDECDFHIYSDDKFFELEDGSIVCEYCYEAIPKCRKCGMFVGEDHVPIARKEWGLFNGDKVTKYVCTKCHSLSNVGMTPLPL